MVLIVSLGVHEAAHGWVALKCGDPTARDLGRITLNPIAHIDPFMTVVLPLILMLTVGFLFGGAKPVPVNFYNLRRPYRDMALVAIAGPLSNFLIAIFFAFCEVLLVGEGRFFESGTIAHTLFVQAQVWNLLLAAFNLLPIPPLDGSRVMTWLLPESLREPYVRLESMGLLLVMVVLFMVPGVRGLLWDTIELGLQVSRWIATFGGVL